MESSGTPIGRIVLLFLGLFGLSRVGKDSGPGPFEPAADSSYLRPPPNVTGYDEVRKFSDRIAAELGLSDLAREQLAMQLLVQSRSESGANNYAGLGIPERFPKYSRMAQKMPTAELEAEIAKASGSRLERLKRTRRLRAGESRAAEIGYDRRGSYNASPYGRDEWVFGSGGYYGQLPSTALSSFRPGKSGHEALKAGDVHPHDVFDPWRSTVLQADFVRRVMLTPHFRNLPSGEQNMKAIRRAAAALSLVKDWKGERERAKKVNANAARMAAKHGFTKADTERRLSRELVEKWPSGGAWALIQAGEKKT